MIAKNLEKKEHSIAAFDVVVEPEAFEAAVNKAYLRAKGSISVQGFRKGKAPRMVIEGMYGPDVFHEDAMQLIAPEAFDFGVKELELKNVGMPSISAFNVDEDKALTLTFSTDVYPEAELGQYKGLEAEYSEITVTEADAEKEIEAARKRAARLVEVDRPVQSGDTIIFDFAGYMDGEAFEGGTSTDYTLEIGSGQFIPGFEDQLIGMEKETEGEVNVTFPEQYAEALAGKPATFKVTIHTVKEAELPELDDDFAKDVSDFETMEEYRKHVFDDMTSRAKDEADRNYRAALLVAAMDNMTCDVPNGMVEDKMEDFLRSYAENMGIGGNVNRADMLKMLGLTEETFNQVMRPNAEKQAKADVLLDKIVEAEGLEVPQEDIDAFWKSIDEDYGEEAEKVKAMVDEKLMKSDLLRKKAASVIYDSGVKKAPAPEAAEEEKKD